VAPCPGGTLKPWGLLGPIQSHAGQPLLDFGQDFALSPLILDAGLDAPSGVPKFVGDLLQVGQRMAAAAAACRCGSPAAGSQFRLGHHFAPLQMADQGK
jgi:hypothetical protein